MKKIFLTFTFLSLAFSIEAQTVMQGSSAGTLNFRKSPEFNEAAIQGSKYFNENFSSAKVNRGTQDFQIRYNALTDLFEYKNNKDIFELIKEQNLHILFTDGKVFELFNYTLNNKEVDRYHQVLTNSNDVKLSKFKSIKLIPAKPAANSYDQATSAHYKENKDAYFVTYKNQTIEFDGKAKDLEKLIPGKASEIKKYFKDNKVKENDADMIKLGQFLSTL